MNPTLQKNRTHCNKGHDLRIHGYYFGTNQRCRECNRRGRGGNLGSKSHMAQRSAKSGKLIDVEAAIKEGAAG